ncbi:unnamed protein product [Zymoseptoria tritici ST99CH_3D7]|uniref:2EXR domain-containing protein n=1 Tax=Zymoseptoria tritici (strain ST99CH_3D7) TaxID=1276538 RepID=A0A1X7S8B7_ZYMT9|nr:unnamed protein product [Zymoseptoria tritici ST99CH_3D7]
MMEPPLMMPAAGQASPAEATAGITRAVSRHLRHMAIARLGLGMRAVTQAATVVQEQDDTMHAPSAPRTTQNSPLLNLPPELRTLIYELVVTSENHRVTVNETGYHRPPLLQTCREARADALKLFYNSNKFIISVRSYSTSTLWKFCCSVKITGVRLTGLLWRVAVDRVPSWRNLVKWLEWNHVNRHEFRPPHRPECKNPEKNIVQALFDMVQDLKGAEYEQVYTAIWRLRPALISLDARWAD